MSAFVFAISIRFREGEIPCYWSFNIQSRVQEEEASGRVTRTESKQRTAVESRKNCASSDHVSAAFNLAPATTVQEIHLNSGVNSSEWFDLYGDV